MNRNKLAKLWREHERLRRASDKALAFQRLAEKLGRVMVDRGKHPMWESAEFPELRALSIPDHGGRDLTPGVKGDVLNLLEEDLIAWEEKLSK